jgi:peroxiredoxin (alkyl hydroperoxide reductase subunit C)
MTINNENAAIKSPTMGEQAPQFRARTTLGTQSLSDYLGRWLVFFSHPSDFTPVCTSEFVAFARAHQKFQKLGCDLLGMSVDSLSSHLAWQQNIQSSFGVEVTFPIVEDPSMAIARAYGMLPPDATSSATVRTTFVIDPQGIIRAITTYPMNVGRNVEEILRLVAALQTVDAENVLTPEAWRPGEPVILPPPLTSAIIADQKPEEGKPWYYRTKVVQA